MLCRATTGVTLFCVIALLGYAAPTTLFAQGWDYGKHRIAVSADGNNQPDLEYTGKYNTADPDDWGATPAALAILVKVKLQKSLVHFSYNNFMPSPPHTTVRNFMKEGVDGAIARWGFDGGVFFDVGTQKEEALEHLKKELAKSSESDPLYFVNMGPSEFLYQAVKRVVDDGGIDALSHVRVLSHSNYNDNHLRRPDHHTIQQVIELSGDRIQFKRIKDQNAPKDNPKVGWHTLQDWSHWDWLKEHRDPNVAWIWESMKKHQHNKADISDAGMMYYLITGDESGSPAKFQAFIGGGIWVEGPATDVSNEMSDTLDRQNALRAKRDKAIESGELLFIEAEEFPLGGDWIKAESPDASGGAYLQFKGENHYKTAMDEHTLTKEISIPKSGTYTVKWCMRQPSDVEGDKSNDIWIGFPDAVQKGSEATITGLHKFYGRSKGRFGMNGTLETHHKHSPLNVEFPKAGVYRMQVSGRSELLQIDRFVLFQGMSFEDARELTEIGR